MPFCLKKFGRGCVCAKTCRKKLFYNVSTAFALSVSNNPNSKIAPFLPILEKMNTVKQEVRKEMFGKHQPAMAFNPELSGRS